MSSRRAQNRKQKTRKNRLTTMSMQSIQKFEQEIVVKFLSILNIVKIYHWKTHSYATHKATDELYSKLNDDIDHFVEVLLGKIGNRVDLTKCKSIPVRDFTSLEQMKREIVNFKSYLVGLDSNKVMHIMSNSDLYNIRDEILGDLNQFMYLLTFS
uniref:Ferritin/DPS protein domain-containing protein n=1 Tax=viral metagenome TaxID=1070528 RepID=A0A6C0HD52_9ZZZZ